MRKGEKLPLAPLGGESRFLPICDLSSKSRRWANLLITKHELCLTLRAQNAQRPPGCLFFAHEGHGCSRISFING